MKIIFLCGSAEPGKDGVGDYTRRLCGELNRTGHEAQILSLCDKEATCFLTEIQLIEETAVTVRRIPIASPYKQRVAWSQEVLKEETPDWVSLQFVPYSYDPKGLPLWLPRFLKGLKGRHRWHIMFHELWVGIEKEAPFKYKLLGLLQKQLIQKIKKSVKPTVVHTQAKIYQYYLSKIIITAEYLPLFGNVSVSSIKKEDSEALIFAVFATIHDNAPFDDFILDLKEKLQLINKKIKFIFIGRHAELLVNWTNILDNYEIEYEVLGLSSEEKISQVLINADYGISSTPYKISDKSGVVAAMREHQLPIISVAKSWVDQDDITVEFNDIIHYQKGDIKLNNFGEAGSNCLIKMCNEFVKTMI